MNRYRKIILLEFGNQLTTGLFNSERESTIEQLKKATFPNLLAEMIYSADCDSETLARAANISANVFYEVLRGKDGFTFDEKMGIHCAFYRKCGYGGFGYLFNSKLNYYDLSRKKHKRKVQQMLSRFCDTLDKVSDLQKTGKLSKYDKWHMEYDNVFNGGVISHPSEIYESGIFLRAEYNMMDKFIKRVDAVVAKMKTDAKRIKMAKRIKSLNENCKAV